MFCSLANGCEHEQQVLAEAGQLNHAIDALRLAPNREKRVRLRELEKLSCSAPALCELKQSCEKAYRRHVAALEAVGRIGNELDAAERAELDTRLGQARAELVEAERASQACVVKQAAVREKYRVDW